MTITPPDWSKLDAITIKQVRETLESRLDNEIDQLTQLIRAGYQKHHAAESYLQDKIRATQCQLDNLHSWAGLVGLYDSFKEKGPGS